MSHIEIYVRTGRQIANRNALEIAVHELGNDAQTATRSGLELRSQARPRDISAWTDQVADVTPAFRGEYAAPAGRPWKQALADDLRQVHFGLRPDSVPARALLLARQMAVETPHFVDPLLSPLLDRPEIAIGGQIDLAVTALCCMPLDPELAAIREASLRLENRAFQDRQSGPWSGEIFIEDALDILALSDLDDAVNRSRAWVRAVHRHAPGAEHARVADALQPLPDMLEGLVPAVELDAAVREALWLALLPARLRLLSRRVSPPYLLPVLRQCVDLRDDRARLLRHTWGPVHANLTRKENLFDRSSHVFDAATRCELRNDPDYWEEPLPF